MTRRTFFATLSAVVGGLKFAPLAVPDAYIAAPMGFQAALLMEERGPFIAARNAETRELLQQMKHDLNQRFYADSGGSMYVEAEDDEDD